MCFRNSERDSEVGLFGASTGKNSKRDNSIAGNVFDFGLIYSYGWLLMLTIWGDLTGGCPPEHLDELSTWGISMLVRLNFFTVQSQNLKKEHSQNKQNKTHKQTNKKKQGGDAWHFHDLTLEIIKISV